MGRIVKGCVRGKPGTGKLYTDVAPPTPVDAWSMALGLQQRFEYYIYIRILFIKMHH